MSSIMKAIENLPSTAAQADLMIERLIDEVRSGATDPLKLRIFLKHFERVIKEVSEGTDAEIMREANKYGTKFTLMDAEVQQKINGAKFQFDKTADPVWDRLKQTADMANEALKERETFLKALPEIGMDLIDEETGDVTHVNKPYTSGGKLGLAITILKGGSKS